MSKIHCLKNTKKYYNFKMLPNRLIFILHLAVLTLILNFGRQEALAYCQYEYFKDDGNRNSLDNLVGEPQHAHFGKEVVIVVNPNPWFDLLYGRGSEDYTINTFLGKINCDPTASSPCDSRFCGLPRGTATCGQPDNICNCTYPPECGYPTNCNVPPKLVFRFSNYYFGTYESVQQQSFVVTTVFVTTCTLAAGESVPSDPEPVLDFKPSTTKDEYLTIDISLTKYVGLLETSTYFWIRVDVAVKMNKTSLGLILQKNFTISQLAQMLDRDTVQKIAEFQQKQQQTEPELQN